MGVRPFYTCRLLRWDDMAFCYRLAKDPAVRAVSHDTKPPTWWGHLRWMRKWIRGPGYRAWVILSINDWGISGTTLVGLLRASRVRTSTELGYGSRVGIAITEDFRGKGIASGQLFDMTPLIYRYFEGPVYASIKPDNEASIKTFKRAGYRRRWSGSNPDLPLYWWHPNLKDRSND